MIFKKYLLAGLVILTAGGGVVHAQRAQSEELAFSEREQHSKPVRLNNKQFEKNLEKYAAELELRSRQIRKLTAIDRKFDRRERKLARKSGTKRKHLRALQETKRKQMIKVLTYEQQRKLESLSKKGFWDFLRKTS